MTRQREVPCHTRQLTREMTGNKTVYATYSLCRWHKSYIRDVRNLRSQGFSLLSLSWKLKLAISYPMQLSKSCCKPQKSQGSWHHEYEQRMWIWCEDHSLLSRGSFTGEMTRKRGKEREKREIKKIGGVQGTVGRRFRFPSPQLPRTLFPSPHPTRKTKETSAEERVKTSKHLM